MKPTQPSPRPTPVAGKPSTRRDHLRGIFFDLGGTLLYPDPQRLSSVYRSIDAGSPAPERWLEAVHHATVTLDDRLTESTRLGEAWWEEYFGEVVRNLSLVPSPDRTVIRRFCDALHQDHIHRNLWSHLAPQAFSVLDRLQEAGLVIGLISNSDGRVREQVEEQGLTARFRFILDSFEEKCEKPDPEIFRRALKLGGIAAAETLYIGDFVNIDWKGATGAGLQAVIIDPTGKRRGRGIPTISRLADLPAFLGL